MQRTSVAFQWRNYFSHASAQGFALKYYLGGFCTLNDREPIYYILWLWFNLV